MWTIPLFDALCRPTPDWLGEAWQVKVEESKSRTKPPFAHFTKSRSFYKVRILDPRHDLSICRYKYTSKDKEREVEWGEWGWSMWMFRTTQVRFVSKIPRVFGLESFF